MDLQITRNRSLLMPKIQITSSSSVITLFPVQVTPLELINCLPASAEVSAAASHYKFQFQMKSRLSIETKGLLEHQKSGIGRCNPQSSSNLTSYSVNNTRTLKHSESSSTLRRTDSEISVIEDRYRTLQHNYRDLLEETRVKGELFRKQKEELQRYKEAHERDQREIMQLRALIDISRKNELNSHATLDSSKLQAFAGHEKHSSVQKQRRSPLCSKNSQLNVQLNTSTLKKNSRVRYEQGKQCFSKYKFVPSLPLK